MYATYQAVFRDKFGAERTTIQLDDNGHQMKILIRDVEFYGSSFDQLSPKDNASNLDLFLIDDYGHLHSFTITYEIPISVVDHEQGDEGLLKVSCEIRSPTDWEDDNLQMVLSFKEIIIQPNEGGSGFEDGMYWLRTKLPEGVYIKSCFNCRFSDYNPYVNSGLMGELVCFVNSEGKNDTNRGKGYIGWNKYECTFIQENFFVSRIPT